MPKLFGLCISCSLMVISKFRSFSLPMTLRSFASQIGTTKKVYPRLNLGKMLEMLVRFSLRSGSKLSKRLPPRKPPMKTPPRNPMPTPPFKTRYNSSPASERDLVCSLPSLTDQQFKDDADINVLCARYRERGYYYNPLSPVREKPRMPQFGDFSKLPDIHTALKTVEQANEMFMRLPAEVRGACGNDPAAFLALEKNPKMQELLKKYGLVPVSSGVQGNNSPATALIGVPNPSTSNEPVPAVNPQASA